MQARERAVEITNPQGGEMLRWAMAMTIAGFAHAALAGIVIANWNSTAALPSGGPPALVVDLATITAPDMPQQDLAVAPPAEPVMQEQASRQEPAKAQDIPPLPESKDAVAALEMPSADAKPSPHDTPAEKAKVDRHKHDRRSVAPRAAALPSYEAHRSATASAPSTGIAASSAAASWRGALTAHLNRYKSYPAGASSVGTAMVGFTINRSGQVTGSHLTGSSGDRVLDQEAVALPKRASPVPAPPEGVGGASIALNVPIRFSR